MTAMPVSDASRAPSVPAALAEAAHRSPHAVALEHRGRRRTYARLLDDVARLARGLYELGVRPGHRVAIVCEMHPEAVIAFHAALRIGAVAVLHDPTSTARELRRAFEDHSAVVAIADRQAIPALRHLPPDVHPKAVIAVDPPCRTSVRVRRAMQARLAAVQHLRRLPLRHRPRPLDHAIPWRLLLASSPLSPAHPQPAARDLALLQYTIGADGELLGAMLTHANLVASARQLGSLWRDEVSACVCATVPLHEPAGAYVGLISALLDGGSLVLAPSTDDALAALRRGRATVLAATPPVLHRLARAAAETGGDLSAVHRALTLQQDLDAELARRWRELTRCPVDIGYVRAECGISVAGTFDAEHPDALGRALPEVRVSVGADAELFIAGPQVFHGYWNRPDETAHVLSGDGWMRTGDRAHLAAGQGIDHLLASRARIVTPDGRSVSPLEVAATLMGHPDVVEARVGGTALDGGGEEVEAAVVLRDGSACTAEDLRRFVGQRLSPVKVPARIAILAGGAAQ